MQFNLDDDVKFILELQKSESVIHKIIFMELIGYNFLENLDK